MEKQNASLFHFICFGVFGDQEFCCTYFKFELLLMYLSDDDEEAAGSKDLNSQEL